MIYRIPIFHNNSLYKNPLMTIVIGDLSQFSISVEELIAVTLWMLPLSAQYNPIYFPSIFKVATVPTEMPV